VSEDQSVASQDAIAVMDADSSERQSTKQKAATSKWAATNAKMMEIVACIKNRSSKVNAECTKKQSVTLDSEEKFSKPVTEPSPVLACNSSDDYLAVCDRKSELVLDIDPRSCQRKWPTKTKTECDSVLTRKCRVIPREDCISDPEESFQVSSEICQDSFIKFCLIYFYLDNMITIFRSVFRDVLEVSLGHVITQERINMMEEKADVTQAMPRDDCSAILSKECITALMSEYSPEVEAAAAWSLLSQ
jgi:hypothetical protein